MARRRYLVAYDIRNERRLRTVASCVKSYGDRVQYSVYICDLSEPELIALCTHLEILIKPTEDEVMIIDLGQVDHSRRILFLGQGASPPDRNVRIV